MVCCNSLSRSSQSCLRCCCIMFCIFLCIGPFLILAGILVFVLPGLQVTSMPNVRTYNTQVRLFSQVEGPLIQQTRFRTSSAVPLLGVPFNDWNRLTLNVAAPAFQGITYGLSNLPSITHSGQSGGVLSTITQYFSVEATVNGQTFQYQQYVPVRRLVTFPVFCRDTAQCTNIGIANCPSGMSVFSGTSTCARNTICGTCSGKMYVTRLCFLVQPSGSIWIPASRQGCFYPFRFVGDYRSRSPNSKLGTTVRHIQDPQVLANDLTKGSMNFDIQILLPQQTRIIALTLIIAGAIFSACGCIISCCLYNSVDGRKCYYRAMGDDDDEFEEQEVMVVPGQGIPGMPMPQYVVQPPQYGQPNPIPVNQYGMQPPKLMIPQ